VTPVSLRPSESYTTPEYCPVCPKTRVAIAANITADKQTALHKHFIGSPDLTISALRSHCMYPACAASDNVLYHAMQTNGRHFPERPKTVHYAGSLPHACYNQNRLYARPTGLVSSA
jgi:hypothetical protein